MDAATLLVLIALLLMVLAYVFQPFLTGAGGQSKGGSRAAMDTLRRRADLLAERNRIYTAIRDLDFDYQTNKVSDEDYAAQRRQLVTLGVELLQHIDALPAPGEKPYGDPIEAAIAGLRGGGKAQAAPRRAKTKKREGTRRK
jgi:hypothetical protein